MVRIAVIDGQSAGIGSAIIKRIRQSHGEELEIWALGTNAIATGQMIKAGANCGATGESAVCHCVSRVDVIIGPISILVSNSMMGEVTPAMATAVGNSSSFKLLLPLLTEPVKVVGVVSSPLPHFLDELVSEHLPCILKEGHDIKTRNGPRKPIERAVRRVQ